MLRKQETVVNREIPTEEIEFLFGSLAAPPLGVVLQLESIFDHTSVKLLSHFLL
jgi:hypothetical protein